MSTTPPRTPPPLLRGLLRFFFRHFYHGFAWTYDPVATVVSLGRWNDWVACAIPYVEGDCILEIGHGPGHLQLQLQAQRGGVIVGLDESAQMGRLAKRRLQTGGFEHAQLARGIGQAIPFRSACFNTVVSTFPAEYIFERQTLEEVKRVLVEGGCFVLLPAAWIVGRRTLERGAAWLFRATDQSPSLPAEVFGEKLRGRLEDAGFTPIFHTVEVRSSEVLVIVARA